MTSKGYLTVRVSSYDNALPIEGAKIIVTDMDGNLIQNLFTDESGVSPQIALEAPPPETQVNPEITVKPYSDYIIYIIADGYLETIIKDVQIFGNSSSVLPVDLPPETSENSGTVIENDIGENALIQPENYPSEMFQHQPRQNELVTISPRIHREVFIPTHITVHLGTPASNARNVTVTFVDYIKNVASSEIFPDWPYHSLRANIHAQISLTLNRVFTEWYRSQGYNFDITNSTRYDQAFYEGRNIFQSVSVIVDEIFNTYVVRPPGIEPFFTEYCDGIKANCPGMKQWGTVSLAEQGRNYLEILRYYYGQNIYIATTNNIRTPYESFPGTLSPGSSGDNVKIIQAQLNRIRRNFPAIPAISPEDGTFGAQTTATVKKFQEVFGLPVTGVVNRATWYRISFIFSAVTKLAELGSEGHPPFPVQPPVTPNLPPFPGTLIRYGSRGNNVALMQNYLNAVGQRFPSIPQQTVDGIFGRSMQLAVTAFQRQFGLTQDGVIGPITWNRIVQERNNISTAPPSTISPPFPGYYIRQGQRGSNVLLMQRYLNAIRRIYPSIPQLAEDGVFGPMTAQAVIAFQRLYGLVPDGVIGPLTWNRIVTVYNGLPSGGNNPPFPGTLLRQGMQNDDIRLMQNFLNAIGKRYTQIPQVEAVGLFGPLTHQAVITFQRLFGLTQDGVIGPLTWNRIIQEYNRLQTQ